MVEVGALVLELRDLAGDQKTMGEARRNVELRKALGRQDNGDMLSEVGRAPRTSTATSYTSPSTTRTSLPGGKAGCRWSPRRIPWLEREWLSCTKVAEIPPAAYLSAW